MSAKGPPARFDGISDAIRTLQEDARQIAKLPLSILITGETGTGKTAFANFIHKHSLSPKDIHQLNCSGAEPQLFYSEIFGHNVGAFTGANSAREGAVEAAEGGTLFLDEIGDMALENQPKLLTFLDKGEYRPLGSDKAKIANVRIIAATSRNLLELVKEHKFNDALYERFDWITEIPPLRERRCDIPVVLQSFLNSESMRFGFDASEWELEELAVELTSCGYDWPGNARSVIRLAKRAMVHAHGNRSRFLTNYRTELLRAMRTQVGEQRVGLEFMLAQYIKGRVELLIRSPEEKNLNHQIQSLLSRGLMEAFDELMKSGSSLSNLKCAGIGEILGHSNLVQSGKGKNRNPLVGKFTSYTFINNAFMMLFERYPEPEILESFLGRDLYRLVGELFHSAK